MKLLFEKFSQAATVLVLAASLIACQMEKDEAPRQESNLQPLNAETLAHVEESSLETKLDQAIEKKLNKKHSTHQDTVKPRPPISVDYRLLSEPAIGQPLTIELDISGPVDAGPIEVKYRSLDRQAMTFTSDSKSNQSFKLSSSRATNNKRTIIVVPQKEGRNYFTVSTIIETDHGPMATSRSIAIQVGDEPYNKKINGQLVLDSNGEAVISMSATER